MKNRSALTLMVAGIWSGLYGCGGGSVAAGPDASDLGSDMLVLPDAVATPDTVIGDDVFVPSDAVADGEQPLDISSPPEDILFEDTSTPADTEPGPDVMPPQDLVVPPDEGLVPDGITTEVFEIEDVEEVQDELPDTADDDATEFLGDVGGDIPATVTDEDGNVYDTVVIGNQVWMVQNLKTRKYRDATAITKLTANSDWTTPSNGNAGAYCDYGNTAANSEVHGRLYNWFAVNSARGLCPEGWHVPSDTEWNTLEVFLDDTVDPSIQDEWVGEDIGGQLKETGTTHWLGANVGATNSSGFTALPGGSRNWLTGDFVNLGSEGRWWTSTKDPVTGGIWYRILSRDTTTIYRDHWVEQNGFSVRCLMD